ncbi:hypothetical protein EG68_03373 [Paragonimus skrjabini miyazakii]|uniref:Uncharacterized protein n=1 Tax=Paragonimus skrjabini miyazakii TaxID=59628 RepID=A0A8S9Z209_9TREM|nr:hypothetical protein EG68_03373 [Paragonimus skrjabini miyazakii]
MCGWKPKHSLKSGVIISYKLCLSRNNTFKKMMTEQPYTPFVFRHRIMFKNTTSRPSHRQFEICMHVYNTFL